MGGKSNYNFVRKAIGNRPKMTEAAASAELTEHFESRPPKSPGVTVRIVAVSEHYWAWWLSLDEIHNDLFGAQSDCNFESPEAAEQDCRERLAELVDRLMGWRKGGALAWHDGRFKNITFVRE